MNFEEQKSIFLDFNSDKNDIIIKKRLFSLILS